MISSRGKHAITVLGMGLLVSCSLLFLAVMFGPKDADKLPAALSPTAKQGLNTPAQGPDKPVRMIVQPGVWFGFRDRDRLEGIIKLGLRGNKDAWERLVAEGVTDGPTIPLKPGDEVYFVDIDIPGGMTKVRRKGETNGWWTNIEAVLAN